MHFVLEQSFSFSPETVIGAEVYRVSNFTRHPELGIKEITHSDVRPGQASFQSILEVDDSIPVVVQKVMPSLSKLIYVNEYFTDDLFENFQMYLEGHKERFLIAGKTEYIPSGENNSIRKFSVDVNVDIPLIGKMIEGQSADEYRKTLEKDHEFLSKLLEVF